MAKGNYEFKKEQGNSFNDEAEQFFKSKEKNKRRREINKKKKNRKNKKDFWE